jgi:hypothetical protein
VTVFVVVWFIGGSSRKISCAVEKAVEEGVRGRRLESCGLVWIESVAEKRG